MYQTLLAKFTAERVPKHTVLLFDYFRAVNYDDKPKCHLPFSILFPISILQGWNGCDHMKSHCSVKNLLHGLVNLHGYCRAFEEMPSKGKNKGCCRYESAVLIFIRSPTTTPNEIGKAKEARGQQRPVT